MALILGLFLNSNIYLVQLEVRCSQLDCSLVFVWFLYYLLLAEYGIQFLEQMRLHLMGSYNKKRLKYIALLQLPNLQLLLG